MEYQIKSIVDRRGGLAVDTRYCVWIVKLVVLFGDSISSRTIMSDWVNALMPLYLIRMKYASYTNGMMEELLQNAL
jgi:hypothetical protein